MPRYSYTMADYRRDIRSGPYAWPGGYPTFFVTSDGACLCHACAWSERRSIIWSIAKNAGDGWRVVGHDANWEDPDLYCDHCNERIESAYAEDEARDIAEGNLHGGALFGPDYDKCGDDDPGFDEYLDIPHGDLGPSIGDCD